MPSSPAHRALFISLVNDAALFPPAALPMADALHRHATHRAGRDADLVGPFLVGVPAVTDLLSALDAGAPVPPGIGLVARPGIPVEETKGAIRALRADPRVRLVSLDAGWYPGWRELDPGELPLHLEVGRRDRDAALDDIAAAHDIADVRAKFRTGATTTWAWPDAKELTDVLLGTARRYLPFVLTGGLHHAVRGEHTVAGTSEQQHGLLNVLVAVHATAGGADARTVRDLLEVREAEALAGIVAGWSSPDVAAVRSAFAGYGCCDVTDPIGELTDLGLLAG
jgi:hypothetical protein